MGRRTVYYLGCLDYLMAAAMVDLLGALRAALKDCYEAELMELQPAALSVVSQAVWKE